MTTRWLIAGGVAAWLVLGVAGKPSLPLPAPPPIPPHGPCICEGGGKACRCAPCNCPMARL